MITTVTLNAAVDKTIICDEVKVRGITRSREALAVAGGKGMNVARAICKLGGDVIATGFVGGPNGLLVRKMLETEGTSNELVEIEDNSRMCLTVIEENTQSITEIYDPSPRVLHREWEEMRNLIGKLAGNSHILTLDGSLPMGLDDDAYQDLIGIIRAKNPDCRVVLDTSGEALMRGIEARPFMIKPNKNEMEALLGRPLCSVDEQVGAVRDMMNQGIDLVVLSLGGDGLVFGYGSEIYKVEPLTNVEVKSTVGCGDALVGGIAKKLGESAGVVEAVKYGVASATSNLTSKTQGAISREQVEEFFKHVDARLV